ncbi:MAG: OmpA family protein [Myxococcales bacterium]|nr:OmpA family protein [Myxococcales bacterium]MDD9969984.1 OmpA family protein [Myxococcales bacterium]
MSERISSRDSMGLLSALGWILFTIVGASCGSPEYPNCDTDEDCHAGEFCINKMCQQCRSDEDCAAGQTCMGGACEAIAGYCESANDCAAGETCENNRCVAAQTQTTPPPPPPPVAAGPCSLKSVYFAYDSSDLEGGSRSDLQVNADCIRERSIGSVHLTGMTDPRGTEEYNMALGDRRAQSAMKYLKSLGVDANVTYSSMGEEMATGQDESGWSRDRRVDIKER